MKNKAFSLVEIITVIILLGIISAVALPRFTNFGQEAREKKLRNLAGNLAAAAGIFNVRWILDGRPASPFYNVTGFNASLNSGFCSSPSTSYGYPYVSDATSLGYLLEIDDTSSYSFLSANLANEFTGSTSSEGDSSNCSSFSTRNSAYKYKISLASGPLSVSDATCYIVYDTTTGKVEGYYVNC